LLLSLTSLVVAAGAVVDLDSISVFLSLLLLLLLVPYM
jgi:hypothetical protein